MLGTVKSLELVGLAAFNVFLAMILSISFLGGKGASYTELTQSNITEFVNRMTQVSTGAEDAGGVGADILTANQFLQAHIGDNGTFKTTVAYEIPDMNADTKQINLTKKDYIKNVLTGLKAAKPDEAATHIENIEITPDARHAKIVTTSYQRGPMPIETDGGRQVLQVKGISYCEQNLDLVNKNIVVTDATCSTSVRPAQ